MDRSINREARGCRSFHYFFVVNRIVCADFTRLSSTPPTPQKSTLYPESLDNDIDRRGICKVYEDVFLST